MRRWRLKDCRVRGGLCQDNQRRGYFLDRVVLLVSDGFPPTRTLFSLTAGLQDGNGRWQVADSAGALPEIRKWRIRNHFAGPTSSRGHHEDRHGTALAPKRGEARQPTH